MDKNCMADRMFAAMEVLIELAILAFTLLVVPDNTDSSVCFGLENLGWLLTKDLSEVQLLKNSEHYGLWTCQNSSGGEKNYKNHLKTSSCEQSLLEVE